MLSALDAKESEFIRLVILDSERTMLDEANADGIVVFSRRLISSLRQSKHPKACRLGRKRAQAVIRERLLVAGTVNSSRRPEFARQIRGSNKAAAPEVSSRARPRIGHPGQERKVMSVSSPAARLFSPTVFPSPRDRRYSLQFGGSNLTLGQMRYS